MERVLKLVSNTLSVSFSNPTLLGLSSSPRMSCRAGVGGNWRCKSECMLIVTTATDIPTSTGSVKPSGTAGSTGYFNGTSGVAQPTGSGSPSGTGSGNGPVPTGGAGATGTASGGPAQSTGAAGRLEVGAAALIAGLGVMAAAL